MKQTLPLFLLALSAGGSLALAQNAAETNTDHQAPNAKTIDRPGVNSTTIATSEVQGSSSREMQSSSQQTRQQADRTDASGTPTGTMSTSASGSNAGNGELIRASKFIGMKVQNNSSQSLGKVKDVVLDADRTHVDYGVLAYGGALGLGEKLFTFPIQKVGIPGDRASLTLDRDANDLKNQDGIDKAHWPDLAAAGQSSSSASKYSSGSADSSSKPKAMSEDPGRSEQSAFHKEAASEQQSSSGKATASDQDAKLRKISEILDLKVVDQQNKRVGEIEDVQINSMDGRIESATISLNSSELGELKSNIPGMKSKLATVQWSDLTLDPQKDSATLTVPVSSLSPSDESRK